jgi:hypothetical protein
MAVGAHHAVADCWPPTDPLCEWPCATWRLWNLAPSGESRGKPSDGRTGMPCDEMSDSGDGMKVPGDHPPHRSRVKPKKPRLGKYGPSQTEFS